MDMPYDDSDLWILVRAKATPWYLYPSSYVLVHLDDLIIEENSEDVAFGGTALRSTNAAEEDIVYESESLKQVRAARCLLTLFDEDELEAPEGCIPTGVAIKGRPEIALYLVAFERLTRSEAADLLDIQPQTIPRYQRRIQPN